MPKNQSQVVPGMATVAQASALAMGYAEMAGANSIGIVMHNAAQTQQASQQIELSIVGVTCAKIVVAAAKP